MKDMVKIMGLLLLIIGLSANGIKGQNLLAAQPEVTDNNWGFLIKPYLLIPDMSGNKRDETAGFFRKTVDGPALIDAINWAVQSGIKERYPPGSR